MNKQIYRGYSIEQEQSGWIVLLGSQEVHVASSEDEAIKWVDKQKRQQHLRQQSGS